MLLKQPQILEKKIAEIGSIQLLQPALIGSVEVARAAVRKGKALTLGNPRWPEAAVFPAVDHRDEQPGRPALLVDIFGLEQLLEQPDLVVGVEYGEGGLQIHELGVATEDLPPDGMEGAEPRHALDAAANQLADALLHFARRLVGEGDGEDLRGPRPAQAQNMGYARGEHARLAGAGAGQHQKRSVERLDRLTLLGVQRIEIVAWPPPHGPLGRGKLPLFWWRQGGGRGANLCHRIQNYTIGRYQQKRAAGCMGSNFLYRAPSHEFPSTG